MALFGSSKRSTLQTLSGGEWSTPEERDGLLAELKQSPPRAGELLPLLLHTDPAVRRTAAELFLARPEPGAVRELLESFPRRSPQVRQALLPILGRLPAPLLVSTTDELIDSSERETRQGAWELALALPAELRGRYLLRALGEGPPAIRLRALEELVRGGRVEAHLPAVMAAADSGAPEVRQAALRALASAKDPRVLGVMVGHLADSDEAVQHLAESYLRRAAQEQPQALRAAMTRMLTGGSDESRRLAVDILLANGDPAVVVPDILELCEGLPGWLRSRILDALRSAGERVLKVALGLMQQAGSPTRVPAIMMLSEGFEDPRLTEPFCRLLGDPDWWLRVTACQVLGQLADTRAVPFLVRTLEDPEARWAAVDALAQIGAPESLKPLSQLLRDPRPEVRLDVLQAFSRFSDQRLVTVLQSVSERDPDLEVRERAGEILKDLGRRLEIDTPDTGTKTDPRQLANPIDKLLLKIREMGASDLHLTVGEPPLVRIDGYLRRLDGVGPLAPEHTRAYIAGILDEDQQRRLDEEGGLDFSHITPGVGRYRANAYVQRLGTCASFRVIAQKPPTFAELRLPPQLRDLLDYHQGIIVISGPSGSGKSTTLNALVHILNETRPVHILTLEDPIEFVHSAKTALVNQRQVGRDTESFASGLRAALREDPDVIVVGELRDADTMGMALKAAETGHLVLSTLHTTSAVQTIDRLVDSFPPEEQAQVRTSLSESLKYVICQRLLPHKSGRGRVAAFEIIKGTLSIGSKIRKGETFLIPGLMQIGRQLGMRTRDQALAELVEAGLITPETAWRNAEKPSTFAAQCDPAAIGGAGGGA
ncbi:MAG: PilT/PilU family type 4a pilus ATPase [Acidobacteria bacterium]|nr:PilT/PilU family type 4a pilus ATPase [Acidobacteriota bacterium]